MEHKPELNLHNAHILNIHDLLTLAPERLGQPAFVNVEPFSSPDILASEPVMTEGAEFHCVHDSRNPNLVQLIPLNLGNFINLLAPESNKNPERSPSTVFLKPIMEIYYNHGEKLGLNIVDEALTPLITGVLWNVKEHYLLELDWKMWNENDQISLTFQVNFDQFVGFEYRPVVINVVPDGTQKTLRDSWFLPPSISSTTEHFVHINIARGFIQIQDLPVEASIFSILVPSSHGTMPIPNGLLEPQVTLPSKNTNFRNVLRALQDRFSKKPESYKVAYSVLGLVADTSLLYNICKALVKINNGFILQLELSYVSNISTMI